MSAIRAKYTGPSGTGVDLTVELDTGENRPVHVKQNGLLPEDIDGTPISAAFRDSLLQQDGWTRYKQPATSTNTAADPQKED
jgi:hypothetical protein